MKLERTPDGSLEVQAKLRGPERSPLTFKVAFDGDGGDIVGDRPLEGRDQTAILSDVVSGDTERGGQLRLHIALIVDDVDAIAGWTGIAPRSAVEVRGDQLAAGGAGGAGDAAGECATK